MNVVMIEIGGIGEGIHNRQLQAEQMNAFSALCGVGSAPAASKLLISSPLKERHYADPMNEVGVNMAAGSPEFSRLGTEMQTIIDQVRRGSCSATLHIWFTKDVADALPERVAEVEIGTGAQAVLSRGAADVEAKRIVGDIRQAIRRARSADDHTVVVVVFGAGSGGTGTGASIEVLRLVRIVAESVRHVTVIAMPVLGARGCELLHDSQQEVEALYARTAGVYRTICAAQAAPHPVPYAVADNLVVKAKQLADIVWFVEGDQGDPSAPRREPLSGLCAAAGGIVEALVSEHGALAGTIPLWRDQAGQANPWSRAGSAGASSIRIDGFHLHQQASLMLALRFYDQLLTRPPGTVNEGEDRASQILASYLAATYARMIAAGEPVAWQPPDGSGIRSMAGLAEQMTDHDGETGPFPCSPNHDVKWLPDEVHTAAATNLWMVSNKSVVENCGAVIDAYMGDPSVRRREDSWTVAGWEAVNRARLLEEFRSLIDAEMLQRSVDPDTGRPYTIRQRPTGLVDSYDLLASLRKRIARFKSEAQRVLADASPLLEQRASQFAQCRAELLNASKSGRLQREFLQVAQADLDVRVWQSEMATWIDIADGWILIVDRWLDEIGDGADGWYSYVRTLREEVRTRGDDLLAARLKFACARNHIFTPQVGGAGEAALLSEMVVAAGMLDQLSGDCRLVWTKTEEGAPRLLIEGIAPAPSREREAVVQRLRELGNSRVGDYKVTNHVSADIVHFAQGALARTFAALTVWDGLAFDYTHIEVPAAERERRTPDVDAWARGLTDEFLRGSVAELALNGDGVGDIFRGRVVWGPLALTGVHPTAARVAGAVRAHLDNGNYSVVDAPDSRTALRAFECLLRVPFDSLALHEPMSSSLSRIPAKELGLYAPEMGVRRAEMLRRVLERHGVRRLPWTFGPAAMTLAADADGTDGSLRRAALALAAGLLDVIPGRGTEPDRLGVVVDRRQLVDFGSGTPLDILETLRDPASEKAVAEVDARMERYVSQHRDARGRISATLVDELESAAEARWQELPDAGSRDQQDLHLLLIGELLDLADAFCRKARGGGLRPDDSAGVTSECPSRVAEPQIDQARRSAVAVSDGVRTSAPRSGRTVAWARVRAS